VTPMQPNRARRPLARLAAARHMTTAMNSTAKPRPMKLNRPKAELVPVAQFARWHELASATPGLSDLELALLSAVAAYHRQLQEKGEACSLSMLRLASANRTEPIYVSTAVRNLISLGLIAVKPGRGNWANEYLPALPRKVIASMSTAAAVDAPPF
jgi:hypothetical protein